jgi:hypothetical protein
MHMARTGSTPGTITNILEQKITISHKNVTQMTPVVAK